MRLGADLVPAIPPRKCQLLTPGGHPCGEWLDQQRRHPHLCKNGAAGARTHTAVCEWAVLCLKDAGDDVRREL
eukprot:14829784-Alexandrium_andersonii.AAC.1